jgi:hypothetical protein
MSFLASLGGSIGGQQRWGIHAGTSGGYYQAIYDAYAVTPDGPPGPGTFPVFWINKTTDNGATWTDVTGLMPAPVVDNEPGGAGEYNSCAVAFDSGIFYILAFKQSTPYSIVLRFDTATDTWLTNLGSFSFIPNNTAGFDTAFWFSIAVNPLNGHPIFCASGTPETVGGSSYARVVEFAWNGAAWTGPTAVPGQAGVARHFYVQDIFYSSTGRAHIFLESQSNAFNTAFNLHEITISAAGTFGTLQTVATDVSNKAPEAREGSTGLGVAYIDHSSVEQIAIPYVNAGNTASPPGSEGRPLSNKIATAVDADVPTWSTSLVDSTTQIGGNIDATESLVNLFAHAGDLYYGWCSPTQQHNLDPSASDVLYSVNTGSGWSAPVTIISYAFNTVATGLNMAWIGGGIAATIFRIDDGIATGDNFQANPNTIRHEFVPAAVPSTATLTLQKVVSNSHGGTAVAADWTVRAIGPVTLSGAGSASSPGLPTGTYALSEGGPPGYSASSWVCVGGSQSGANITLAGGDVVTCTITNSDIPPGPPAPPSMCEPVTVTTPTPSLAAYNEATEKQGT